MARMSRKIGILKGKGAWVTGAWLLLSIIALCPFAAANSQSRLFVFHDPHSPHTNLNSGVDAKHLWFEDTSRTPYSECWYYLFFGHDGTIFFCHITLARLSSLIPAQYSLDFNLIFPDGEARFFGDSYKKSMTEWKTDRLFVRLGNNVLEGDLGLQKLHIEELGYHIDLEFTQQVPPYRDGCGRIYLDAGKTNYLDITYQPSLNVSATISGNGRNAVLKGWGYSDHVRQTFIPTDFAKILYAFRIRMGDLFMTCLEYFPHPTFRTPRVASMIVAYRDKILHVSHDYSFEGTKWHKDPPTNATVPSSFKITEAEDGFRLEATADGELLQRVDLLGAVKPFQKRILQLVGIHSYSYVFKVQVSCNIFSPAVQGLFSGTGIFEAMVSD